MKVIKLNESGPTSITSLKRYLDVEIPDLCVDLYDVIENLPENEKANLLELCRNFYDSAEHFLDW